MTTQQRSCMPSRRFALCDWEVAGFTILSCVHLFSNLVLGCSSQRWARRCKGRQSASNRCRTCRPTAACRLYLDAEGLEVTKRPSLSWDQRANTHRHSPMAKKEMTHCSTEMICRCFSILELQGHRADGRSCREERMLEPVPGWTQSTEDEVNICLNKELMISQKAVSSRFIWKDRCLECSPPAPAAPDRQRHHLLGMWELRTKGHINGY